MKTKVLLITFIAVSLSTIQPAGAQQPARLPRIGYLSGTSPTSLAYRTEAFRQGLQELGYVEGKTIIIDYRYAEGRSDRVSAFVAELVRLKVDVIVSGGNSTTQAAMKATNTIPIVMTQSSDPVASGFVASLARPGGNVTGLSQLAPELSGKRLELLKEIVPNLARVAFFGTSAVPGNAAELKEVEVVAAAFGVKLQSVDVLSPKDLESAFQASAKGRVDAVLMNVWGGIASLRRKEIAELAVKSRLPVIYETTSYVEAGGLMSYGVHLPDLARRAATYVDKILKGRKPADLPVEQPIKFEFVINLKAAKAIGLTIPPNVLLRADRVIR